VTLLAERKMEQQQFGKRLFPDTDTDNQNSDVDEKRKKAKLDSVSLPSQSPFHDKLFSFLGGLITDDSALQRFSLNMLFDRNLLPLIFGYAKGALKVPLSFGSRGGGEMQFNGPLSLCVHPISGDLWVADTGNNRLCVHSTESKQLLRLKSIKCKGRPLCVRISNGGHVVVTESVVTERLVSYVTPHDGAVSLFDEKGVCYHRFGEGQLKDPYGVAINETLQQVAISDSWRNRIDVYTLEGVFVHTLSTRVSGPWGICWNENDALLFVSSRLYNCVYVIDMENRIQGSTESRYCNTRGMVYHKEAKQVLTADYNNKTQCIMNYRGIFVKTYGVIGTPATPVDIALHPDYPKNLFVCDWNNNCIHMILMDNCDN
jgi:DNA-binding beta-propeller fold protein YncE